MTSSIYSSTETTVPLTLVTTTAFVPKDVAIKMNLLLLRILNGQNDMYCKKDLVYSCFLTEHMFWIFVRIASLRQF